MLIIDRHGDVLILTLDRPDKRNSLHPGLIERLGEALAEADRSRDIRVVVLTGAGTAFSAGLDLQHLSDLDGDGRVAYMRSAFDLFRSLHELRQPVIGAINGPAMAGGFDLAAFCDLRFCSEAATFAQTEILLGLTQIMSPIYHTIGLSRAKDLAMSGRSISADEAFRIGLADRVYRAEDLLPETLRFARMLSERPPAALFDTKRLARQMVGLDTLSALDHMFETIAPRLRSEEHDAALQELLVRLHHRRTHPGD